MFKAKRSRGIIEVSAYKQLTVDEARTHVAALQGRIQSLEAQIAYFTAQKQMAEEELATLLSALSAEDQTAQGQPGGST